MLVTISPSRRRRLQGYQMWSGEVFKKVKMF
jgi:hypothetical protein